ncbi:hypothetical protein ACP4OV_028496 [Aristida adscensionis]
MGEGCDAVALGAPRQGGGGDGGGWVLPGAGPASGGGGGAASSGTSSSSLFSSTSSLTDDGDVDDDATSSQPGRGGGVSSSSLSSLTSSESETMQTGVGGGVGPLYELSTMMDHLPGLRWLSKYYQGRSQSFQSLADVKSVEDLAKKTAPYSRRRKPSRGYAAALGAKNRLSKTIAKRAPKGSPDRLICRARSIGLSLGNGKPPAYQDKRDTYRC